MGTLDERLSGAFGTEGAALIRSGYVRRPVTLRVNTLKSNAEEVKGELARNGISHRAVPWYSDALVLETVREEEVSRLGIYEEGKIYLQSLSSMLPPLYLGAKAGESVLDMTAAPGGKTTQILACSGGGALVTACERDRRRFERLLFNLKRQGAGRVTPVLSDALRLDDNFSFDKILLDAPCSGSGTFVSAETARLDGDFVRKCAARQVSLLKKGLKLLKNGGILVYSTCSVLPEENGDVISAVLGAAELVPLQPFPTLPLLPSPAGTVCVRPDGLYEGFFVAALRKK